MKRIGWRLLQTALAVYLLLLLALYALQRQMIYHPTPPAAHRHSALSLAAGEQPIEAIVVNPAQRDALIYFGGNAESMAQASDWFAQNLPQRSVYLLQYRGYGGAVGTPDEAGIYADALQLHRHVSQRHPHTAVMGRSLGSAVATHVAASAPIERLILITPFDSIRRMAAQRFWMFPVHWILTEPHDSIDRAGAIDAPVLVLQAARDAVVPAVHTQTLAHAFKPQQLQWHVLEHSTHNSIQQHARYAPLLRAFLQPDDRVAASTH